MSETLDDQQPEPVDEATQPADSTAAVTSDREQAVADGPGEAVAPITADQPTDPAVALPDAAAESETVAEPQAEADHQAVIADVAEAGDDGAEAVDADPEAGSDPAGDAAADADEAAPVPSEPQAPMVETIDRAEARASIQAGLDAMDGDEDLVPDASDLPPAELRGVLEAVLLTATKPLAAERMAKLVPGTHPAYLDGFLAGLAERFTAEGRGWDLRQIGGGWQFLTRPQFHAWVRQLDRKELPTRLSRSAMETLAIVAYQQPISRGRIEDVRGVQSGPMLRQLMDLKLVAVVGRDESALGHPLLYGTTQVFLERFGLSSPDDLPRRHEFGD